MEKRKSKRKSQTTVKEMLFLPAPRELPAVALTIPLIIALVISVIGAYFFTYLKEEQNNPILTYTPAPSKIPPTPTVLSPLPGISSSPATAVSSSITPSSGE